MSSNEVTANEQEYQQALEDLRNDIANWQAFFSLVQQNAHMFTEAELWELVAIMRDFSGTCESIHTFLGGETAQA